MAAILKKNIEVVFLFVIFLGCVLLRPAFPVDETRYLTAAWEMWLKKDWIHLSVNFQPYSHKPPMLFWLINIFWNVFGVSRWAATLPSILSAVLVALLTPRLAQKLFPGDPALVERSRFLILGSLPFLLYGSLIMFDTMLSVFILLALFSLKEYAERRQWRDLLLFGLCMGLGGLTKGPVICLYTLLPALCAPLWMSPAEKRELPRWYAGIFISVLAALVPVLFWLVPTLQNADHNFAYWLIWEQTAGRVTGGFGAAHARPVYFYLPLVPVFLLPWILFPAFWKGLRPHWQALKTTPALRFIACCVWPGFIAFCLISGKQPHYLMPFVPLVIIGTAHVMKDCSVPVLRKAVWGLFFVFAAGNLLAEKSFFPLYDLRPLAGVIAQNPEKPVAYIGNYNGELGFMGRMDQPVTIITLKQLPEWFQEYPGGLAVIRYKNEKEVKRYEAIITQPYRGSPYAGVFKAKR